MGVVYRAYDPELQREVAIKVLSERPAARALDRFRLEGEAAARVRHPNVLAVHDLVFAESGQPYMVMDFAPGGSLRESLARRGPLDSEEIVALLRPLLAGVAALHAAGIVHRDLKPENILIDGGGQPLVADLGLARALDRETRFTQTGALIGTPAYMAPEQLRSVEPTAATDVYALGTILFELLTGQLPFAAESLMEFVSAIAGQRPPAPRSLAPGVDPGLEAICLRCLEKEPARRYASAEALGQALAAWEPGRGRRLGGPRLWLGGALGLAALGLAALGLFVSLEGRAEPEGAPTAPGESPRASAGERAMPEQIPAPSETRPLTPALSLRPETLLSIRGLELRRAWTLVLEPLGLRLKSCFGEGPQLSIPFRFRRAPISLTASLELRAMPPGGTQLRLALVPDEPIHANGRPGGGGILELRLGARAAQEQVLHGLEVSYTDAQSGQIVSQTAGLREYVQPGPIALALRVELGPDAVSVALGPEHDPSPRGPLRLDLVVPPGSYRLELSPTPTGYLPDDPTRQQLYRASARDQLDADQAFAGFDILLKELSLSASPGARLTTYERADVWGRMGRCALRVRLGKANSQELRDLTETDPNTHVRDECFFFDSLLQAETDIERAVLELEGLERLYLDGRGVDQTSFFDDASLWLGGRRLAAYVRAGIAASDLPRSAIPQLQASVPWLPLQKRQGKRAHHAATRALYCLLAAKEAGAGVSPSALGVAWLFNGDLERAESLLEEGCRLQPDDPSAHYYAGLCAYYRRDFAAAQVHWERFPALRFPSQAFRGRLARARRLAR